MGSLTPHGMNLNRFDSNYPEKRYPSVNKKEISYTHELYTKFQVGPKEKKINKLDMNDNKKNIDNGRNHIDISYASTGRAEKKKLYLENQETVVEAKTKKKPKDATISKNK